MCKHVLISFTSDSYPDVYNMLFAYDTGYDLVIPLFNVNSRNFEEIFLEAYFGRQTECSKDSVFFINIRPHSELEEIIKILNSLRSKQIAPTVIIDPKGAYTTTAAISSILHKAVSGISQDISTLSMTILGGAGNIGIALVKHLSDKLGEITIIDKNKSRIAKLKEDLKNTSCNINFIISSNKREFVKYCRNADIVVSTGPPKVNFLNIKNLLGSKCKIAIDVNAVQPSGILGIKPEDDNTQRGGIRCTGYKTIGKLKRRIQKDILIDAMSVQGKIFDLNEAQALLKR